MPPYVDSGRREGSPHTHDIRYRDLVLERVPIVGSHIQGKRGVVHTMLTKTMILPPSSLPRGGRKVQKRFTVGLVGVVIVGVVTGAIGMNALSVLGIEGLAAQRTADAILAGMDIAAALSLFAGVTSIAAGVLWLLKRALKNQSKRAIMA